MRLPFEGLFGDTCETRLLAFLLPMYGIEFEMAELVDEIGMTRQSLAKATKKFAKREMIKIRKDGRTPLYSINEESPLVKRLEDFDNTLIASMIGPEEFAKIRGPGKKPVRDLASAPSMKPAGNIIARYSHSPTKVPGVSSRQARYLKKQSALAR